jgi:peptidoglycan/LPS O-acetylase OafA/YrhL
VNEKRLPQLDGLRAVAVLLVLYHHWVYPKLLDEKYNTWYLALLRMDYGKIGVTIFFCLSGLLITEIIIRSRNSTRAESLAFFRAFFIRRSIRIFPIYFLVILVATLLDVPPFDDDWLWFICYGTNILIFLQQNWIGTASPLWTLSVEEQFYILWPVAFLVFPRNFESFALVFLFVSLSIRLLMLTTVPEVKFQQVLPIISMDAIVVGGLLALDERAAVIIKKLAPKLAALLIVVCSLLASKSVLAVNEFLQHLAILSFSTWIVCVAKGGKLGGFNLEFLKLGALTRLGIVSYGIYLYHPFVQHFIEWVIRATGSAMLHAGAIKIPVMTVLTIAIAWVSWVLIERPFNNLKRFVPYR